MCYRKKEKCIVTKNWKKARELDKQLKDEPFSVGFFQKEKNIQKFKIQIIHFWFKQKKKIFFFLFR